MNLKEFEKRVTVIKNKFHCPVFILGDIHGDFESFKKMTDAFIEKKQEGDLLITLGDYSDKGPDGVEVIDLLNNLLQTRNDIIALKGNHEDWIGLTPHFSPCSLIRESMAKRGSLDKFYEDTYHGFLERQNGGHY